MGRWRDIDVQSVATEFPTQTCPAANEYLRSKAHRSGKGARRGATARPCCRRERIALRMRMHVLYHTNHVQRAPPAWCTSVARCARSDTSIVCVETL
eukprot:3532016-Pyramimonas_sp.AAC.1